MMAKRTGLRARIVRLESRKNRRPLPRLIYALYPHEDAGEPTGYMAGNVAFVRGPDETLEQCAERGFATGATHLVASYARAPCHKPRECEEDLSGRPGAADATKVRHAPSNPLDDYYARAGIGIEATPEQLWEMGALPGPPERPR
jgi:hypothetical protein